MIDLSIIIVNWNVIAFLTDCLESIAANQGELVLDVIVVDSGSTDGSVACLREEYKWIRLIALDVNVGFTRGNNLALQMARGKFILLLNPDTRIVGDMLQQMVTYLKQHPDVGGLGPHTLNPDGTTQSSKRRFPTLMTAFLESTWLQPIAPTRILDRYYANDIKDDACADVDWVQGHALMIPRKVYHQAGGMDEGYLMFYDEVDWCKRMNVLGWRVVYLGTAQVIHYGGQSTSQATETKYIAFNQSKLRYFRKYHGRGIALILRTFLIVMFAWQLAREWVGWKLKHNPDMRYARVVTYHKVIKALI